MSRVFNMALEQSSHDRDAEARERGEALAKKIAKVIDAAASEGMVIGNIDARGPKIHVQLYSPSPSFLNESRRLAVSVELEKTRKS